MRNPALLFFAVMVASALNLPAAVPVRAASVQPDLLGVHTGVPEAEARQRLQAYSSTFRAKRITDNTPNPGGFFVEVGDGSGMGETMA